MPQHKQCEKRMRQSAKARERNRRDRSRVKTAERRVTELTEVNLAADKLSEAYKTLDRMASKGILHLRTAARHKARLSRHVKSLNT